MTSGIVLTLYRAYSLILTPSMSADVTLQMKSQVTHDSSTFRVVLDGRPVNNRPLNWEVKKQRNLN